MTHIRTPAVAGMFYPADANTLQAMVDDFLAGAETHGDIPKALIVPHAGYIYSGPIAASAYHLLEQARHTITRVILLGPSHRVPLFGLAVSSADYFSTPLGNIPLDRAAMEKILPLKQVRLMDEAHTMEHSLEVQLPFLQSLLEDFTLVPLVVGDASAGEVGDVLETLWGGPETLIVISSDLSHYHDYATAKRMDQATSQAIETLQAEAVSHDGACGRNPIKGLLAVAARKGLHVRTVDLRNSGDTAGPRDQVVGYGAYVFDDVH